jgi:hypothetical protein
MILLLKCPETLSWREENVNSKWSHVIKKIAPTKILTVKNATAEINSGTLTYGIKCKWENQAKKI